MATRPGTMEWIVEQGGGSGVLSARKMFGEYGVWRDGKLVALVCDDQLYVKPTPAGRVHLGDDVHEAPPYPTAKPCLVVGGERWDDRDWLTELFRLSAEGLPKPKARKATRA